MSSWKSKLCSCDTESIFLSCIVPCHVYAKLSKSYTLNLCIYLFLWINIHSMYLFISYIYSYQCPSSLTDHCIGLGDECKSHFMVIDGTTVSCVYVANICTYNTVTCVTPYIVHVNVGLGLFFIAFFDIIIVSMHYHLRKRIEHEYQIHSDNDCIASTCCSSCGLAQEYRETIL
jgi:hypothetical protein